MVAVDETKCVGCSLCARVCPHGVLGIQSQKAVIMHADRCIECGACDLNCSSKAITVNKGTGCLLIIIKEDILKMKKENCCC